MLTNTSLFSRFAFSKAVTPGIPIYRIMGVLQQVRTQFVDKMVCMGIFIDGIHVFFCFVVCVLFLLTLTSSNGKEQHQQIAPFFMEIIWQKQIVKNE